MRLVLHSTHHFKTIDGKPHRIWTTIGRESTIIAYIDHIEVPTNAAGGEFEKDLKRVETDET